MAVQAVRATGARKKMRAMPTRLRSTAGRPAKWRSRQRQDRVQSGCDPRLLVGVILGRDANVGVPKRARCGENPQAVRNHGAALLAQLVELFPGGQAFPCEPGVEGFKISLPAIIGPARVVARRVLGFDDEFAFCFLFETARNCSGEILERGLLATSSRAKRSPANCGV